MEIFGSNYLKVKRTKEENMDLTEAEKERSYLLYVKLPNLINRIIRLSQYETPSKDFHNEVGEEIKKVSSTEVESALKTLL